jgi:hypothetical protein
MKKNIQKLIGEVAYKCIQNKIFFHLDFVNKVDQENLPCSGYFDEKNLVVATNKKNIREWLDVLVHESCHLDQFLERSKLWVSDEESLSIVEAWINKKNISEQRRDRGFFNTIALELDCEKRTIIKIKKYGLDINKEEYIQKANSYLFSYLYALIYRKWYPTPYENSRVWRKMPKNFLTIDEYFDKNSKYLKYFVR